VKAHFSAIVLGIIIVSLIPIAITAIRGRGKKAAE
jgi:hypothetical protein